MVKKFSQFSLACLIALIVTLTSSVLVVAHDQGELYIVAENYPPYEMEKPVKGQQGFDYEVAMEVFKRLGFSPRIYFLPWKRALHEAQLGKTVGILTCAYLKKREEFIIFSDPISKFTNGFYIRKNYDGPPPLSFEDVRDQQVGSVTAYESTEALIKKDIIPIEAPNTESAILMLKASRFDYLYANKEVTDYEIKKLELTGLFTFYPIVTKDFYFCFSRKYPGIKKIVKEFKDAMSVIKANGTFDRIHAQYR
ncbi:MAG: transporter substrate-binding domain-containing protein [Alphaproteobacteria bacterium]|nr:transporter substrate-binding domain-containing protein [Alphaproteobacteria bacterium]